MDAVFTLLQAAVSNHFDEICAQNLLKKIAFYYSFYLRAASNYGRLLITDLRYKENEKTFVHLDICNSSYPFHSFITTFGRITILHELETI